jgi:dolichol-phosphate mannosyltransferase
MFSIEAITKGRAQTWGEVGRGLLPQATRFARFAAVGASGVVVNNVVLYFLVEKAGWIPVVAAVVATEVAIISNFTLNDRWTFADMRGRRTWFGRAAHYNVVVLGGLLISVSTLFALTAWLHIHYLIANLVGIAAGMVWNYTVNLHITWRKSSPEDVPIELWKKAQ